MTATAELSPHNHPRTDHPPRSLSGAAEKRTVVRRDQIVARTIMGVTLSADHRVVDGAVAAEFLRTLKSLLEEPGMMLV